MKKHYGAIVCAGLLLFSFYGVAEKRKEEQLHSKTDIILSHFLTGAVGAGLGVFSVLSFVIIEGDSEAIKNFPIKTLGLCTCLGAGIGFVISYCTPRATSVGYLGRAQKVLNGGNVSDRKLLARIIDFNEQSIDETVEWLEEIYGKDNAVAAIKKLEKEICDVRRWLFKIIDENDLSEDQVGQLENARKSVTSITNNINIVSSIFQVHEASKVVQDMFSGKKSDPIFLKLVCSASSFSKEDIIDFSKDYPHFEGLKKLQSIVVQLTDQRCKIVEGCDKLSKELVQKIDEKLKIINFCAREIEESLDYADETEKRMKEREKEITLQQAKNRGISLLNEKQKLKFEIEKIKEERVQCKRDIKNANIKLAQADQERALIEQENINLSSKLEVERQRTAKVSHKLIAINNAEKERSLAKEREEKERDRANKSQCLLEEQKLMTHKAAKLHKNQEKRLKNLDLKLKDHDRQLEKLGDRVEVINQNAEFSAQVISDHINKGRQSSQNPDYRPIS